MLALSLTVFLLQDYERIQDLQETLPSHFSVASEITTILRIKTKVNFIGINHVLVKKTFGVTISNYCKRAIIEGLRSRGPFLHQSFCVVRMVTRI